MAGIYDAISNLILWISMVLIYHYIYWEKGFEKEKSFYLYTAFCVVLMIAVVMIPKVPEEISTFLSFFCFAVYIFLVRKEKRVRGMLLVIPISGFLCTIVSCTTAVYYIWAGRVNQEYLHGMDFCFFLLLLLFWRSKKMRQWRQKMHREQEFRRLSRGERFLLNFGGVFLFVVSIIMIDLMERYQKNEISESSLLLFAGSICTALLLVAMLAVVIQGNKKEYFQYMAMLNETYLQTELEHFEWYRQTQKEVRRIRHDMKNHYAVLYRLAEEKKYEELQKYLEQIGEEFSKMDAELHCGNDIGDAILNEKNQKAKEKGISLQLEGQFTKKMKMKPIDLCILLSNALDNAIEYLEQAQVSEKWIRVELRGQGEMWLLRFENPVEAGKTISPLGATEKSDRQNHGFGTINMERTVQKYGGSIKREILKNKESVYCLEMIVFTTKSSSFTTKYEGKD